ncbi:hypothetical protein C0995_007214 [Termitomyces sp. Mi166|nr:hypothetical protein C0995_007214 [Termitomyces sp. Mi166\
MSSKTARRDEEEESGPEEHDKPKQVFVDEQGNEIWFFLHKSITSGWQRRNLENNIESNGGVVRPDDSHVDTVLVDSQACNKDDLQLAYNSHRDPSKRRTWVEHMSFVSRCLNEGAVRHRQPEPKGMGGSLGLDRTPYTDEDDDNLARYLAIRIPDIKSGGRRGNGVYQDLYQAYNGDPKEYSWVTRHTWQSWRNRYNKNIDRFNDMINTFVESEKPERKQAYHLQRKHKVWQWANDSEGENEELGNPSKRRRIDPSPTPLENHVEVRRSPIGKGKGRAIDEDVNDARREPSSPLHNLEPYTSQATLVEPSQQTQEPRLLNRTVVDPLSQQRERSNVARRETGAEVQESRSPSSLKEPNVSAIPVSSGQKSAVGASTKTVSASPQHRPMARKMAQQPRPQTVIAPSDPPYRNTRSRSRSVEPSDLLSRPKSRRKKGTAPEHRDTTLPSLEELVDEGYQESLEKHTPAPVGETLEEERDVEDLLVNGISGRSQATEDELQNRAKDNSPVRSAEDDGANELKSLDSDDAQTDRRLRQPLIQARTRVPSEELDVGPDEMLRRFREASINTPRSSKGPNVRSVPFSRVRATPATRPRHSAPVYSQDVFGGVSLVEHQTPTPATNPQFRLRQGSTSSIESFPIAGTKASAAKKNIETEEKRTPYRPPVGTRAALLTKEQHTPRVQKVILQ